MTSYEITIQSKFSLVQNPTALTFFLHSKGVKQTLALQAGLFPSIVLFILCCTVPFINDLLSKTMLYVQCTHILLKMKQCFFCSSFIRASSTSLLLPSALLCPSLLTNNTKIQFLTTQRVRGICLSGGCTQV